MQVKRIMLENFRNYDRLGLEFSDGVNIVAGRNAQGKTNLLEAIFFCAIGKSLRASKEREVIKFEKDLARVKLEIQKKYRKTEIEIIFSRFEKKTIKIDGIPIKKIGELFGEFNAVYFSPDELKLVKESPEDRRRFMDIHISQTNKEYFYLLGKYEKNLQNRNRLLKDAKDSSGLRDMLSIWDNGLVEYGAKIIKYRLDFIKKLQPLAESCHNYLTRNNESLKIEYTNFLLSENLEDIKNGFREKLQGNVEKDFRLGYTTFGPHRDDLKIFVNGLDIRTYGSQGQQRTVALSLKLAELEIINKEIGEMPILLLDDVLSELDKSRQERLFNFCSKTQTFITGTDFEFNKDFHYYEISNGKVEKH